MQECSERSSIQPEHLKGAKRGPVTHFSTDEARFMAQTFGAWLAGVPLGIARDRYYWAAHMDRVTFATWTFGRDFKLADHAAAFKQHRQRIQRAGGRGHWWIELQCRGAPHIHAYLAGLTEGCMARLHEQWLADPRVAATRAGPQGQYHEGMRAAEAAMAKEASKVVQKAGWNGRYWGYIDRKVMAEVVPPVEHEGYVPVWATRMASIMHSGTIHA